MYVSDVPFTSMSECKKQCSQLCLECDGVRQKPVCYYTWSAYKGGPAVPLSPTKPSV